MKLSFVVTTQGAMKTLSSSVEYAVMYASAWIFVSAPIVRVVLDERAAADHDVVADRARARARRPGRRRSRARRPSCPRRRSRRSRRSCPRRARAAAAPRASRSSAARASAACRRRRSSSTLHALAEHRPRVDDRGLGDLGVMRAPRRSEACSRSSALHDGEPVRAASRRSPSPSTRSRKCVHSSRSGSSFAILGLKMSPGARLPLAVGLRTAATAPSRRSSPCARAPCRRRRPSSRGPTTVIFRILCGSSHERCMCAILPGREAEVAEDDVLDARRSGTRCRAPTTSRRLLARAGRGSPRGRGRRATRARSRPVRITPRFWRFAVDAEHVAELAGVDELLQLAARPGW